MGHRHTIRNLKFKTSNKHISVNLDKKWRGPDHGVERGAQAYNGSLGAEPPAGPGAELMVRRSGGEAPTWSWKLSDDHTSKGRGM